MPRLKSLELLGIKDTDLRFTKSWQDLSSLNIIAPLHSEDVSHLQETGKSDIIQVSYHIYIQ